MEQHMTQYRLVSFKACPWVQRAAIVLREKDAAFEFVHIEPGNRPDWFHAISPLGKVPVLQIDDGAALFESNAIAEYLDETIAPRLHPADPITRASNRAWTDYLPSFAASTGALMSAATEDELAKAREALSAVFARLEKALERHGEGPFFNGADYAIVDAGYAPFLQRYLIVEEITGDALSRKFPRLRRWALALADRPSTHTLPPEEFRSLFLNVLKTRGGLIAEALAPAE
jgi:glutathione S-transferase